MADSESKEKTRSKSRDEEHKKGKMEVMSKDKDTSPERRGSRKNSSTTSAKTPTNTSHASHDIASVNAQSTVDANELMLSKATSMFDKISGSISKLSATVQTIADKQAQHDAILANEWQHPSKRAKYDIDSDYEKSSESENDDVIDQINQLLGPSTSEQMEPNNKSNADEQWLAELAMELVNEEQKSAAITPQLAKILEDILTKRLSEEKLKVKLDAYPAPENVAGFTSPKVNPEVWSKIKSDTRSRDIRMQKAQQRVVRGLTPLAQLAEKLLLAQRGQRQDIDLAECLTLALNSFAMIANGNIELSLRRREMIRPDLNSSYRELCAQSTPITDMLFGDDLARVVKDIKETNQVATKVAGYGSYMKGQSRFGNKGKSSFGAYRKPYIANQQVYRPAKNFNSPSFKKGKRGSGMQQNRR